MHLKSSLHAPRSIEPSVWINTEATCWDEPYHDLEARAEALDPEELETARLSIRPEEEKQAVSKVEDAYGSSYDYATMREARNQVSDLLGEEYTDSPSRSLCEILKQKQQEVQHREVPHKKASRELER